MFKPLKVGAHKFVAHSIYRMPVKSNHACEPTETVTLVRGVKRGHFSVVFIHLHHIYQFFVQSIVIGNGVVAQSEFQE
jgi:hypothetical protein